MMSNAQTDRWDVIVGGGGPAGSTTAALLAAKGLSVLLLERDRLPRFKIGESLMPHTYGTFDRLGLLEKLKASAFPRKYSVQFVSASGKASAPFYFFENDDHESSVTWQVLRSDFDRIMIENAEKKGAEVRQEVSVQQVLFQGDRAVGVRAKLADGRVQELWATVIVDATGQNTLIARQLDIRTPEPELNKASIYTHFEGGLRGEGIDEGATLILHTANKQSWFWYIPLPDNRVSVGVVGSVDYLLRHREADPESIFAAELERCPALRERLPNGRQVFPVKVMRDFSYKADRIAGDSWVMVGDAFGFLDPIYSSGILLALKSGEWAADAISDAFGTGDFSGEQLGRFGPEFLNGMEAIRKLVYAFYAKDFSFARFVKRFPECKQGIIDILSGNVFSKHVHAIFEPMREMCSLPEDWTPSKGVTR